MTPPHISVIHPAARPHCFEKIFCWWHDRASKECKFEFILATHAAQFFEFKRVLPMEPKCAGPRRCEIRWTLTHGENHPTQNGRSSYCGNVNNAAMLSAGEIIVLATDDLEPPFAWDRMIRAAIPDPTRELILQCSNGDEDSDRRDLILHPIMSRARYERQGWFVCPEYSGLYSDSDLTERAAIDGVVKSCPHIRFVHHHPVFDPTAAWDQIYFMGNSLSEQEEGRRIFERRKAAGFPLTNG